jgi:hypothetical protein
MALPMEQHMYRRILLLIFFGTFGALDIYACFYIENDKPSSSEITRYMVVVAIISGINTIFRIYEFIIRVYFYCKNIIIIDDKYLINIVWDVILLLAYFIVMCLMTDYYFEFDGIKCGDLHPRACVILKINLWCFMIILFIIFIIFLIVAHSKIICESRRPPTQTISNTRNEFMNINTITKLFISREDIEKQCCSVCLIQFEHADANIIQTCCGHYYHEKCIDMWTSRGNNTCPNCRGNMNGQCVGIENA